MARYSIYQDRKMNIPLQKRQKRVKARPANRLDKNRFFLLDQLHVEVSDETFENLCQMIDQPPQPSQGLLKLMQTKAPWS